MTDLELLENSHVFEHAYITKRNIAAYADVLIVKCHWDKVWYRDLIGFTFFCRLHFDNNWNNRAPEGHTLKGLPSLRDITVVRLTKTTIHIYNSIAIEDAAIL